MLGCVAMLAGCTTGDVGDVLVPPTPVRHALTINKLGAGQVLSAPAGIDCGTDCNEEFDAGTEVTLSASAATGYEFVGWSGDGVSCAGLGPCKLTVSAARSATATFSRPSSTRNELTVTVAGSGRVTADGGLLDCSSDCSAAIVAGSTVTLRAAATAGYRFAGWSVSGAECAGTAACAVEMSTARSVTATFVPETATLRQLKVTVSGSGAVGSLPSGIDNCSTACEASYADGTIVTLAAAPAAGYRFQGWSGAGCSGNGICVVTLAASATVNATFIAVPAGHALNIIVNGAGRVSSVPAGIDCGADCAQVYPEGTRVTLTAAPAAGYLFSGWTAAECSGTGACEVVMNATTSVAATFVRAGYPLSVTRQGTGTVTSSPAGISCGATCSSRFDDGSKVTLTAVPAPGQVFTGWQGAGCAGTAPCTVTVNAALAVGASFEPVRHGLTVALQGAGTVSSLPAGIDCGASCTATYDMGTDVTLSATPASGQAFVGWTGACAGKSACTLTMASDQSVGARFEPIQVRLSVAVSGSGTVTSTPAGIDCASDCNASFDHGSTVSLAAAPASGQRFVGWGGACAGSGECRVTLTATASVSAAFEPDPRTLSVTVQGAGTVRSTPAGIDCGTACSAAFDQGSSVALVATPAPGQRFVAWSGACAGSGACSVVMSGAVAVGARFEPIQYTVTVGKQGSGTVTSAPAGIVCGATCSASFAYGTTVTLTAMPAAGYTFSGWTGVCTGSGSCSLTVAAASAVVANFAAIPPTRHALNVAITGSGGVQSAPAGVACGTAGSACSATFDAGTEVTLTATPSAGHTFAGWSAAQCPGTGACVLTMNAATTVTARFNAPVFTLSVSKQGTGSVTSAPAGIDCGSSCSAGFSQDTVVTLTATPGSGQRFVGWSGDCSGSAACSVTMSAAHAVVASFTPILQPLTVTRIGSGGVASTPAGIDCGATCSASFSQGSSVVLAATPATGYSFSGWSGACTGRSTCSVTMSQAVAVTATFDPLPRTLSVVKRGLGSVASTPAGINCGSVCSATFGHGSAVTLSANAGAGHVFAGWSGGGCSGTGNCTVTLTADTAVSAVFNPVVSVDKTGSGTVTSAPSGVNCGAQCSAAFPYGAPVTFTATPAAGQRFIGWSGACSGTGTCTLPMTAAASIGASFGPIVYTVSVSKQGNGTVNSSPSGVSCGSVCSAGFASGTVVTLNAAPASGYTFSGWSGAGCSGTDSCTVTVNGNLSISANFTIIRYALTVTKLGSGTVTSAPAGINCGTSCAANFDSGSSVTLTAVPGAGFALGGWSGACTGTASTCVVSMSVARFVTANFVDGTAPTLAITSPTSAGTYGTSASTVVLAGTASDNVGVTQVSWSNSAGGSGTATLVGSGASVSWTTSAVPLQPGSNTLTVTAVDATGHSASRTLTVTSTVTSHVVRVEWTSDYVATLQGYRVYYGSTADAVDGSLDVGLATDVDLKTSVHGRFYIVVVAVGVDGVESARPQAIYVDVP